MALSHVNRVLHQLRKVALTDDGVERTDGQLLECFVSRQEAAALEALVVRHGPMVWGVCRRLLDHHDAKDAKIQLDGKEAKLENLKVGMRLSLQTTKDSLTIIDIKAVSPKSDPHYTVKAVDALKHTITVTLAKDGRTLEAFPLAKDARIEAEYLNVNFQAFESQDRNLSDLRAGMRVHLEMALVGGKLLVKAISFSE